MTRERRDNSDLLEAVSGSKPKSRGKRWGICPRCEERTGKPDRHGKLAVWPSGFVKCYKCDLLAFIESYAVEDHELAAAQEAEPLVEVPEGYTPLYREVDGTVVDGAARSLKPARDHLRVRGLLPDPLYRNEVGATARGRYAQRIVFPFVREDGEWVGFVARTWLDKRDEPRKYLNSVGFAREAYLYNRRALDVVTEKPAFIVEGAPDALALWPDGVAVLGKVSEGQKDLFRAARRPIVMAGDGDAWAEGEALALELRIEGQRVGALRLAAGLDPDEIDRAELDAAALESLRTD